MTSVWIFCPAGFRGIEIPGKFLKVTAIGFYVEDGTVPFLASKWKGKEAAELSESGEFIDDIVKGEGPSILPH